LQIFKRFKEGSGPNNLSIIRSAMLQNQGTNQGDFWIKVKEVSLLSILKSSIVYASYGKANKS